MNSYEQPVTSSLQSPAGWEKRPLGGWLVSVVAAVFALAMAAIAVSSAGQGDVRDAIIFGVIAVVLLTGAILARPKVHSVAARMVGVDVDGVHTAGIRFAVCPPSWLVSITLMVAGLGFVALGGTAAVLALRDGKATAIIGFVVLAGLGSIFLLGGFAGLRSSRTQLGLDLTEGHVVVGLGFDRLALPWSDIARIDATSLRYTGRLGMRVNVQHWLLIAGTPSSEPVRSRREHPHMLGRAVGRVTGDVVVAMPTSRLGSDPVVVFHALRHYLKRPDDRVHLTTGAAAASWPVSARAR